MAKKVALAGIVSLTGLAYTMIEGSVEAADGTFTVTSKRAYSSKLETRIFPADKVASACVATADEGGYVVVQDLAAEVDEVKVEDVNAIEIDEDGFATVTSVDGATILFNTRLAGTALTSTSDAFDAEGAEKPAKKAPAKKGAEKAKGKAANKKGAAKKEEAEEEDEEWDEE